MTNYPESDIQFLARCLVLVREGDHLNMKDARRLNQLATYGHSEETLTTMPEERGSGNIPPHLHAPEIVEG